MARMRTTQILGIVLLVVGIGVLVYGYTTYDSLQGKFGYEVGKALHQKSETADQAVTAMIVGGVVAVLGLVTLFIPAGRRSGRSGRGGQSARRRKR